MQVTLQFGLSGNFECELDPARLVTWLPSPLSLKDVRHEIRKALAQPLDFPPLSQTVVDGDCVVLAVERHTPQAAAIIAEIWAVLVTQGVAPEDVLVLQPASWEAGNLVDPRSELPEDVRETIGWKVFDATDPKERAYLGTSNGGERIYLAHELVEADLVINIGEIAYDPLLGYRGTGSVFYPGLASMEAFARMRGEGHDELGPDEERPLRQLMDEISWMLGVQFSVQVLASSCGGIGAVFAGLESSVGRAGRFRLDELRRIRVPERVPLLVIGIDQDAGGHGWKQLGAAFSNARRLVAKGGKVIVLSEVAAELGDGMRLIRESRDPREALKPLRRMAPPDLRPAAELAALVDWANVYLLSRLDLDLVEELFMMPLASPDEALRLLAGNEPCVVLSGGQHSYAEILA